MPSVSKVKRLPNDKAAYIAGLVDGEGTITLTRLHRHERRRLVLSISNTESALLEYVHDAIGAGKITGKRTYRANHAPGLTYTITSRQALAVIEQISPYLRSYKKKRALLALRLYIPLTPRNGRYTRAQLETRLRFEMDFLAIKPRSS